MQYMPFIVGGGFLLMAIIIVPLVLRKTRKARQKTNQIQEDFRNKIIELGMTPTENGAHGMYKGYEVDFKLIMGSNRQAHKDIMSEMVYEQITGKDWFGRGDYGHHHDMYYPTLHVQVKTKNPLPKVALIEPNSYWKNSDEWLNKGNTTKGWDKMELDAKPLYKKAKFYGQSEPAAQKMLNSDQLKSLLKDWAYPDIRAEQNELRLTLDNSNLIPFWGFKRISNTDYIWQGVDIAVESAKALEN